MHAGSRERFNPHFEPISDIHSHYYAYDVSLFCTTTKVDGRRQGHYAVSYLAGIFISVKLEQI